MEQWIQIRQRVLREGVSKRQILRETDMHWATPAKILTYPVPPGYRRIQTPKKAKIDNRKGPAGHQRQEITPIQGITHKNICFVLLPVLALFA